MKNSFKNKKGGFTLLFASLVVSLVLAIGLSIADISLKQFLLASSGKESQVAFYDADTGVECAIYYDYGNVDGFSFPTNQSELNTALSIPITCNGQQSGTPTGHFDSSTGLTAISYFINAPAVCDPTKPSFQIEVDKTPDPSQTEAFKTEIFSRGYNTCDFNNPRRVERGLEVKY